MVKFSGVPRPHFQFCVPIPDLDSIESKTHLDKVVKITTVEGATKIVLFIVNNIPTSIKNELRNLCQVFDQYLV